MGKQIAILGFGREGKAAYDFLLKHGASRSDICILDENPGVKAPRGARAVLGENYLSGLEKFGVIYRSPGMPYSSAAIQKAKRRGAEISSATKLFFGNCPAAIVGITGTKGKSTTSTLLCRMLKAAGRDAYLAGNIGAPALSLLPKLKKSSIVVLELSSFQLQDLEESPRIAAVLDVFPDHQNSHKNLKEYYGAKSNIARFQKKSDAVFYFPHNAQSRRIARLSPGKRIPVESAGAPFEACELLIKGGHHALNAAMAAAVAARLGASRKAIRKAALSFKGLPHRIEFVRRINSGEGAITFWNDSASANPGAAAAAVRAFRGERFMLIAGGKEKRLDYQPLADALRESPAHLVILYGENKARVARALRPPKSSSAEAGLIRLAADLRAAVAAARAYAEKELSRSGGNVAIVLSPGTSSFDMFRNFEDRGDAFKKLVREL